MSSPKYNDAKPTSDAKGSQTVNSDSPEHPTMALSTKNPGPSWFFDYYQHECGRKREGLLIPLPPNHPSGNCIMIPYSWTEKERDDFQRTRRPPVDLASVPVTAECVVLEVVTVVLDPTNPTAGPCIESDYSLSRIKHPYLLLCVPESPQAEHVYLIPSEHLKHKPSKDTGSQTQGDKGDSNSREAGTPLSELISGGKAPESLAMPFGSFHAKAP